MQQILVAVDEDKQANKVIAQAGTLAEICGAHLTICHVMPQERYHRIEEQQRRDQVAVPYSISQAEMESQELARNASRLLQEYDVVSESVGRVGDPAETIVALAEEIGADLIMLGFEGLSGLGRIRALGSVSRAVLEQSSLPVLVVPAEHDT